MKKILMLSLATLGIAGCAKGHSSNPITNVIQKAKDPDLQATFTSDCKVQLPHGLLATKGQAALKSLRTQYVFSGTNLTLRTTYFTNVNCSGDSVQYEERGTFVTNKDPKYKTNDGGYRIDMHFKKLMVRAESNEGAIVANALGWCGVTWTTEKSADVTDHSAQPTCYGAAEPRDVYNVYRVDNGVLTLGVDSLQANSPQQRPARLTSARYRK